MWMKNLLLIKVAYMQIGRSLGLRFELQTFNKLSLARNMLQARAIFYYKSVYKAISKDEVTDVWSCEYFSMRSADYRTVFRSPELLISLASS